MNDTLRDFIEIYGELDHTLKADGFDDCIVGMDSKQCLVYDIDDIVEQLIIEDGMTHEDALEHFYFNIEGSYVGDYTPVYIHSFKESKSPKKPLMTLGCEEIDLLINGYDGDDRNDLIANNMAEILDEYPRSTNLIKQRLDRDNYKHGWNKNSEEKIAKCKHLNINHQPEESDTNSTEYRYCEDCGEELPLDGK